MRKKDIDLNLISMTEQISILCGRPGRFNEITSPSDELAHWYYSAHSDKLSGELFLTFNKMLQISIISAIATRSRADMMMNKIINKLDDEVLAICLYHFPHLADKYDGKFPAKVQECASKFLTDFNISNNSDKFDDSYLKTLVNKDPYCLSLMDHQTEELQLIAIKKCVEKKTGQLKDPQMCYYIERPTEKVLWEMIKYDPNGVLKSFKNQLTPEMKSAISLMA